MVLSGKQFLRTFAISIGRCCPKKRRSLDVMMKRVARDPLLLKKLSPGTVVEVSDSNGNVKYDMNGKKEGAPVVIRIRCSDTPSFEAVLNGENLDKLRLWAEEKIVMEGDLATSMIVTDALFRYAELIGRFNLPWPLYRLIGRNLIQEGSCIPSEL
jgi:hypothetical protein